MGNRSLVAPPWPSSNEEYWHTKITGNAQRDANNAEMLINAGWKVITVWECELKKSTVEERLCKLQKEIVGRTGPK